MQVFEVWPVENDPDAGPSKPPEQGNWTWWRTGEHPKGRFQAMDWRDRNFPADFAENQQNFPIMQDAALGEAGDWGGIDCHACHYSSDGYPSDPGHKTQCDGVCRRQGCTLHGEGGRQEALKELSEAYLFARSRGLSKKDIAAYLKNL